MSANAVISTAWLLSSRLTDRRTDGHSESINTLYVSYTLDVSKLALNVGTKSVMRCHFTRAVNFPFIAHFVTASFSVNFKCPVLNNMFNVDLANSP